MISFPFETFYFKDYLIDCSIYNTLSIKNKKTHGYIAFYVNREQPKNVFDESQVVEVKIPFDCE